jgi:hypothetical protein
MMSSVSKPNEAATFETLNFDNLALQSLPIDPNVSNHTREVRGACFSRVGFSSLVEFDRRKFLYFFATEG